jgi:hypothetical protein
VASSESAARAPRAARRKGNAQRFYFIYCLENSASTMCILIDDGKVQSIDGTIRENKKLHEEREAFTVVL